jgi:pimeloyl-ACP methyl ester carboxylesterase
VRVGFADEVLRLEGGRALGFRIYGDRAGSPLLFLHGTPGSRLIFEIAHAAGRELGLAIIAPDRWNYGLSHAPKAPSLRLFAGDMAALMDHLGHSRFGVGGISGGGPYAVSVAACLPSRVTGLALVSPVGPVAHPSCRGTLTPFHRFCFGIAPRVPLLVAGVFALFRASLRHTPHLAGQLATLRAGSRDKGLISRPEIASWLLRSFHEGLRPGLGGPALDLQLFSRHWDVDLDAIEAPTHLWVGTADTAVPISAIHALAIAIRPCTVTKLHGEGHLWVAANYREILKWVVERRAQDPASAPRVPDPPAEYGREGHAKSTGV